MSLPAGLIALRRLTQEELRRMLEAQKQTYGFGHKTSLRMLYGSLGLFSLVGLFYFNHIFREYTLFNQEEVHISDAFEWQKRVYKYSDIKEIHQVKFFIAPNGNRILRPHYVLVFNDGRTWASRENFGEHDKKSEENLLQFIQTMTPLEIIQSRYYDEP